jgi:NADH:ubiquinone oxidoreductase subunit H
MMCSVYVSLFLGGGLMPMNFLVTYIGMDAMFYIKVISLVFFIIFLRANLPRFRFDQLMFICWKCLLPIILGLFLLYIGVYLYLQPSSGCQVAWVVEPYINVLLNSSLR